MYTFMVIVSAGFMLASAIHYVICTWRKRAFPVLATWILMFVMMSLSCWMYMHSDRKSLTSNIAVTSGVVNISIILIGLLAVNLRDGTLVVSFNKVQINCLVFGGVIVVIWFFSGNPLLSYILVQCVALIAYFATVKKLLKAKRTTEPTFVWLAVLIATLCAIYPAWVKNDVFAWIYILRALPSTAFVTFLILKMKRSEKLSVKTGP